MRLAALSLLFVAAACTPASKPITNDTPSASSSSSSPAPPTSGTTTTATASSNPNARPKVVEAAADTDTVTLIRTKRLEAKADGRVLVVYVSATWCEPCKKLKRELDSGRLDERLSKITFLAFDADKDMDRLGAVGYTYKFVPFVALPGVDGHPTDSQQATGKGADAWKELLGKLDAWQR